MKGARIEVCGIAGIMDYSGIGALRGTVSDMASALAHRGPDDQGFFWRDGAPSVALAHRRLRVIDLSEAGKQPMTNEDGSVWLVFNGEIYNYKALKEDLEKKGHKFRSSTDSEVILHQYEELGTECTGTFQGMFAFALWDSRKERLMLARDRLGVKPLVYMWNGARLSFASEIKALLSDKSIRRELDPEALELFFTFNFIPAPWTIYKSIRKLPQASVLLLQNGKVDIFRYWEMPRNTVPAEASELEGELRELVADATRSRMYSDVPIGAFLSGGIDSSIVVANMATQSSRRIKTFFIGYEEDRLFDEASYARDVAHMYDTEHHELRLSVKEGIRIVPEVLDFFDEPFADSSAIPTFLVSRLTRKFVTVALSGDGGDEIFGGYRRYWAGVMIGWYLTLPAHFRKKIVRSLIRKLPDSKGNRILEGFRRAKIFVDGAEGDPSERHLRWMAYFPEKDRGDLLDPELANRMPGKTGLDIIRSLYTRVSGDEINRMLYTDVNLLLPYDMLTKVDWMSMYHALEIRSPFLDYRISELLFSVRGRMKVHGLTLKHILRKTFADQLPASVKKRSKQGFEVPVGEWLKRSKTFQDLFWDTVGTLNGSGVLRRSKIETLFQEHTGNRRDNSHKLWAIMVFLHWYRKAGLPPL